MVLLSLFEDIDTVDSMIVRECDFDLDLLILILILIDSNRILLQFFNNFQ